VLAGCAWLAVRPRRAGEDGDPAPTS
jgi:hypothetical protein